MTGRGIEEAVHNHQNPKPGRIIASRGRIREMLYNDTHKPCQYSTYDTLVLRALCTDPEGRSMLAVAKDVKMTVKSLNRSKTPAQA